MKILFAISVLSFLALAWAALAVARRVRRVPLKVQPVSAPAPDDGAASRKMERPTASARRRPQGERYDKAYASESLGDLNDPGNRPSKLARPRNV